MLQYPCRGTVHKHHVVRPGLFYVTEIAIYIVVTTQTAVARFRFGAV
jgi:hypothetical protein